MATKVSTLMRHVLEVRLEKRFFGFTDIKGELVDSMARETDLVKVKIQDEGSRVDMVNEKGDVRFFFSVENFGFQLEECDSFEPFREYADHIIDLLENYGKYKYGSIIRIGARSTLIHYPATYNPLKLQTKYRQLMFQSYETFAAGLGLKLNDVGLFLSADYENDDGKLSLTTGPATEDEAKLKMANGVNLYQAFNRSCAVFMDIDFYKVNPTIDGSLKAQVTNCIDNAEKVFTEFINLFPSDG